MELPPSGYNPSTMPLDSVHKNAWITFFVASRVLVKKVDRALEEAGLVPMEVYDVLLLLEESPDRRLRMSELADIAMLSRSGITRLADRLARDGYIRREGCPTDRRSQYAVLTQAGLKAREQAWPVYRRVIEETFAADMTCEEAKLVSQVFSRFVVPQMLIGYDEASCPKQKG